MSDKNPEIWGKVAMADHFEKIQKLKDKIDGVPNFRRVPGYKVFCCGQPTKEGFVKACEKVCCRFRLLSRCNNIAKYCSHDLWSRTFWYNVNSFLRYKFAP